MCVCLRFQSLEVTHSSREIKPRNMATSALVYQKLLTVRIWPRSLISLMTIGTKFTDNAFLLMQMKWGQEVKEKQDMFALLAEEIKMAETRKANSRAQLLKLQQKVKIDSQLARDDLRRLEEELSRLYKSRENPDILLEDVDFFYSSVEASSSASSAPDESSEKRVRHWICMMCLKNEVSIVFLPCTHQVVCSPCYSENFKTVGDRCPFCKAMIEESIRVYGPSS